MALVKLGSIVTALSGKVGGQYFANRGAVTTLNTCKNPNSTPSSYRQAQQLNTFKISQYWRTMPNANQVKFINEASNYTYKNRVGDTVTYNGFELFMLLNQGRLLAQLPIIDDPLSKASLTLPSSQIVGTNHNVLTITASNLDANNRYLIWCSGPISPGVSNANKYLKLLEVVGESQLAGPRDFTNAYKLRFQTTAPGDYFGICIQAVRMANGQRGARPLPQFYTMT